MRRAVWLASWVLACAAGSEGTQVLDAQVDGAPMTDLADVATDAADRTTMSDVTLQDTTVPDSAPPVPEDAPEDRACASGQTRCGEVCAELTTDRAHCGACDRPCGFLPGGVVTCEGGVCRERCAAGATLCDAACYDTRTDTHHCGACGRVCEGAERCVEGRCLGPAGYRVVRDDASARWINACALAGHQTVLVNADAGAARVPLPFRFRFWGRPLEPGTMLTVTPDGYATFQDGAPTPPDGVIPNQLDRVNAVLAVQWRNLRTRAEGVCVAVDGNVEGARRWVVQWRDARYFTSDLSHLNLELVLHEGSNHIDIIADAQTLPEPATVALEDWEGLRGAVPFGVPQPILFSNSRARFIPE
ncbi:MAG: hypothetical protein HY909_24770 [Deltaproteobacteria bacterium]|nr:hypothetical protein [Deltaproteobacteria bacterium]